MSNSQNTTVLLIARDVTISFSGKPIFEDLTMNIHEGSKIALVGKNGAGKTTLMKIITGDIEFDSGERLLEKGVTIGYMQQDVIPKEGQTVFEYIFENIQDDERELHEYKVDIVAEALELRREDKLTNLSGGQLRRAALARALVEEPDILLLDEPTNHLDLQTIEWLEDYLKHYRGSLLCVSHDKTFLGNVTNKIFWLDRGDIKVCSQGFSHFDEWSEALLDQEARELKNRKQLLAQEIEWASRGVKARRKRNVRRLELVKEERDRLKNDESAFRRATSTIQWKPAKDVETSSRIVAEFYNVHKSFADHEDGHEKIIFNGFNLRIMRGDRIGVIGQNGSGKTTFLKMMLGNIKPDTGSVKRAKNLEVSYFDQKRSTLNMDDTLIKTLCPAGGEHVDVNGKQRHVMGYLKDFMFDPQMATRKVASLSGGQKNRLMLAKVLASPGDLLILDEPTNDLDMDTLDMLEDILSAYKGTLYVVSHDRDFLDQTVSQILAFEGNGKIEHSIGGYSDYLEIKKLKEKKEISQDVTNTPKTKKTTDQPKTAKQKKLSYKEQYALENLPKEIAALENTVVELTKTLADPELYNKDKDLFFQTSQDLEKAKTELDQKETQWLELEEKSSEL